MKYVISIVFIVLISFQAKAQEGKPAFSFCGKTGDVEMTWEEFEACKKELITLDKAASVSSFIVTVKEKKKKDFVFLEFPAKGNQFSKSGMDKIRELYKDKKLGDKIEITNVEVVQSGKAAKQVPGMVITLK